MISRYFLATKSKMVLLGPKWSLEGATQKWTEMDRFCSKMKVFLKLECFRFLKIFYFSFDGSLFVETEQNRSEFNRTRARPSRQPHTPVLHCWTHTVFKPYNPDYFLMIYGIDWNFVLILEIILRRKWREGWCMLIIT